MLYNTALNSSDNLPLMFQTIIINHCRSQWSSGWRVRLWCERTQVRISPRAVVFITTATAIYSLGHRLCTFTAVPRSTRPSTLREMLKWVSAFGLSNNKMAMVDVDNSNYRRTHSPSRLAWSEGWRPPGAESAFIIWTGWTLAMALRRDDSTINIVVELLLLLCLDLR